MCIWVGIAIRSEAYALRKGSVEGTEHVHRTSPIVPQYTYERVRCKEGLKDQLNGALRRQTVDLTSLYVWLRL